MTEIHKTVFWQQVNLLLGFCHYFLVPPAHLLIRPAIVTACYARFAIGIPRTALTSDLGVHTTREVTRVFFTVIITVR